MYAEDTDMYPKGDDVQVSLSDILCRALGAVDDTRDLGAFHGWISTTGLVEYILEELGLVAWLPLGLLVFGRGFPQRAEFEVVESSMVLACHKDLLGACTLFILLSPLVPVPELVGLVTARCCVPGVCFRAV